MENRIAPDEARLQKIEFRAMGSHILAAVESDDPRVAALLAEVPHWFADWEQTLSRFREDSELSRLNRAGSDSSPVEVSDTLWAVLHLALEAARDTGGLVTPTLLNALEAAGYNATFGQIKVGSSHASPGQGTNTSGGGEAWRNIKTYADTRSVSLPADTRLDFGGVGKGWAADEAVKRLAEYGPALVDAGGDIAVSAGGGRYVDWPIGVDAPSGPAPDNSSSSPDDPLELLAVRSGGVATSGRDFRRWQQGGQWRHHIIDPRTQLPAETDVLTATIVGPTTSMAEVAAKAVLLLGSEDGLAWLDARLELAGLLVLEDGKVLRSRRFDSYIWSNENGN